MSVKLTVGLQKKAGLPDYGSVGACCEVCFEIDSSLLFQDRQGFQEHVRDAFLACQQAVHDQLAAQLAAEGRRDAHPLGPPAARNVSAGGNGEADHGEANGRRNGSSARSRKATANQVRAIRAIASRNGIGLADVLDSRFGVTRPEELSLSDASTLIDELKEEQGEAGTRRRAR